MKGSKYNIAGKRLVTALLGACCWATQAADSPKTSSCYVEGLSAQVQCGTISVPLNYGAAVSYVETANGMNTTLDGADMAVEGTTPGDDEARIDIGFVVLPSFNAGSQQPPLFFLAGGPGQSATSLAGRVSQMFSEVRSDHDVVLIDQRGTGRSAPLKCDQDAIDDLAPTADLVDEDILAQCVAELPQGIEHFTTANAVRDFEAVREYLGFAEIDLYGGSYGSRAALAYLALAGDHVRAVILDGISPPAVPIGLFGASAAESFERAIARCQSVPECAATFPELREQFARVDQRLRAGPIETTIPHPITGVPTLLRLWHGQFISLLRLTLYDPSATALMPLLISEADAGNFLPLASLSVGASASMDINPMLNLIIICNEDYPRFDASAVTADADNGFGRNTSHKVWQQACSILPRFQPELAWMTAGGFSHPALLLSGAADPVTPPANGKMAEDLFQNARHIVSPNSAHIVASSECGGSLIAAFLADPNAPELNTQCLADIPAQRFMLDTMGSLSTAAGKVAP